MSSSKKPGRGGAAAGGANPGGNRGGAPSYSKAAAPSPSPSSPSPSPSPSPASSAVAPRKSQPEQEIFKAEVSFQQLQKTQEEIEQKAAAAKKVELPKPKEEPKEEPKREEKEEPKAEKKEEKEEKEQKESIDEEGVELSREQSEAPEPTIIEHPLEHKWVFWGDKLVDQSQKHHNYIDSLQQIAEVSTIEQFFGAFNNLPSPSKLPNQYELHLFKKGIQPIWEDPQNSKGGNWTFFFSESTTLQDMDNNWRQLVLTAIGGILDSNNYINGVGLIRRGVLSKCRYQVWTKVSRKVDAKFHQELERHIKELLQGGYKNVDYKDQEKVYEEKSGPRHRGKN